ncbi:hypothetical protein CC86DRAFT_377401 [Ophiobolus disseminans]|uniref:Uncharacterized protein n=1 Tax=Ophiobolus disseminans TaxID=1469910 RepID=A0A6A7AFZ7_9PLEO|nr:hypothetical protein CC86DRAFT_377401 [Ophiobolus disseminans]
MDLPQELNDMVYHHLWQEVPAIIRIKTHRDIKIYYENMRGYINNFGLPQWLLTSKAILEEGLEQFKTKAIFLFPGTQHWIYDEVYQESTSYITPLVDVFTATRLCIRTFTKGDMSRIQVYEDVVPEIQRLADIFGPHLCVLSIILENYVTLHGSFSSKDIQLPIPNFKNPSIQIRRLELFLKIRGGPDTRKWTRAIPAALEIEVTNHGKSLVGADGRFEIKETKYWDCGKISTDLGSLAWIASFTKGRG